MTIRNETYSGGVVVNAEVIDLAGGTWSHEIGGKTIESRPLTADEVVRYTPVVEVALPVLSADALKAAEDTVALSGSDLNKALDPKTANPDTAARLAALESIVALLIDRLKD